MLRSIQGVFREGRIELIEPPPEGVEGRVIVTFLDESKPIDLAERGIDRQQASDLRRRLAAFTEDWQQPEMDVYDAS